MLETTQWVDVSGLTEEEATEKVEETRKKNRLKQYVKLGLVSAAAMGTVFLGSVISSKLRNEETDNTEESNVKDTEESKAEYNYTVDYLNGNSGQWSLARLDDYPVDQVIYELNDKEYSIEE